VAVGLLREGLIRDGGRSGDGLAVGQEGDGDGVRGGTLDGDAIRELLVVSESGCGDGGDEGEGGEEFHCFDYRVCC